MFAVTDNDSWEEWSGKIYPAEALMEVGIPMPLEFGEYKAYQIYLEMVE